MKNPTIIALARKYILLPGCLLLLTEITDGRTIATTPVATSVTAAIPAIVYSPVIADGNIGPDISVASADTIGGTWSATIKGSKIMIEFKSGAFNAVVDDDHWWDNTVFELAGLPDLPKGERGTFSSTREAGTIAFTGKFDGDQGSGTYKFTADPEFKSYIKNSGVTNVDELGEFTFFTRDLKKDYIAMLQRNGLKGVPAGQVAAMFSLKIDEAFIQQFRHTGYNEVPANQLIALRSKKVNSDFIKEFNAIGYTNIPIHYIIMLKSLNITPDFITGFNKLGFTNIQMSELQTLKSKGITPEYVADMQQKGFKSDNLRKYIQLKNAEGK